VYVLAQLDVSDNLVIYMPIKLTDEIIAAAIEGFQVQKNKIDDKIAELRSMLGGSPTEPAVAAQEVPVGKRKRFSAAARRKMALGQQARWAKIKGQSEPPSPAVPEAPKAKRKISAEGMKRIIAATKKRWRLQKAKVVAEASAPTKKAVVKSAAVKKTATKKVAPVKKAAAKKATAKKTASAPALTQAAG